MIDATEKCPACGATLRENVPYCVACGLPRPTAAAAPTPAAVATPAPAAEETPAPVAAEATPIVEETAPMAAIAVEEAPAPVAEEPPAPTAAVVATTPAAAPQATTPQVAAPEQSYNGSVGPIVVILAVALIVVLYLLARSGAIF